jgi:hypothetical protein
MKIKLKNITFENLEFCKSKQLYGNIVNFSYNKEPLEFQTPKVLIEDFIKENNKEYILLKILPTEACKTFCSKLNELEETFNKNFKENPDWFFQGGHSPVQSIFKDDCFLVKIPFRNGQPQVRFYTKEGLVNYNILEKGMCVICLITIDKLWISNYNDANYYLTVKEMMIT